MSRIQITVHADDGVRHDYDKMDPSLVVVAKCGQKLEHEITWSSSGVLTCEACQRLMDAANVKGGLATSDS